MTGMTRETLIGPPHECPHGCGEYQRLSRHWSMGCGYPDIPDHRRAAVEGMILGNGGVAGQDNQHAILNTTNETFAHWLYDALGWMGLSLIRETRNGDDDREPIYHVRTYTHEGINRYRRWYHGEDRVRPPEDYRLTPRVARVWWACVGGLQWSGAYDSQRTATISALADGRAAWVTRLLQDAGVAPTRVQKRVQWQGSQVDDWLDWIGEPVPGVKHKWADTLLEYRMQRADVETAADLQAQRCIIALEIARERTAKDLTPTLFDERVDGITSSEVAEYLGGGSWEDALSVAGVQKGDNS